MPPRKRTAAKKSTTSDPETRTTRAAGVTHDAQVSGEAARCRSCGWEATYGTERDAANGAAVHNGAGRRGRAIL